MGSAQKSRFGKNLLLIIRIVVVLGGLAWAAYWLSQEGRIGNLINVFKKLSLPIFIAALAAYIAGQVSCAIRWWILLRTQQIYISIWAAIKLFFLGLFYNNFIPSSVGGDVLRAWYVTKHTEKKFEAVLSIFVDRFIGFVGSIVIAVVFYFFLPQRKAIDFSVESESASFLDRYKLEFIYAVCAIVLIIFVLILIPPTRRHLQKLFIAGTEQIKSLFSSSVKAAVLYCRKPFALFIVFAMTIVLQIVTISGFWLAGRQLGVDVSLSYYLVFFTISWSIGMLPITFGGAVLVEGSMAAMFVKIAGVSAEAALALALCQRIAWMLGSLPGALIHITGKHLPDGLNVNELKKENV